jgi:hypothetical protein
MLMLLQQQQQAVQQQQATLQAAQATQGVQAPLNSGLFVGSNVPGAVQQMAPGMTTLPMQTQPAAAAIPYGTVAPATTHHGYPGVNSTVTPSGPMHGPGQPGSTASALAGVPAAGAAAQPHVQATSSLKTLLHNMQQQQARAWYNAAPVQQGHQHPTSFSSAAPASSLPSSHQGHQQGHQQWSQEEEDLADLMNLCGVE